MATFRTLSLLLATMTTGLAAGVFLLYAHTVMPGLATTDDRTFVTSYAALDKAIVNPLFMLTAFLGALVWTAIALVVTRGQGSFRWTLAALTLYLVTVVVTFAVHLPLNDALKHSVAAGGYDPAAVRAAFHAARWEAWNWVRVVTSVSALGCLCWALVLHGRATA